MTNLANLVGGTRRSPLQRWMRRIGEGRFQRELSAASAGSAVITSIEIYLEHYRASFGDPWMWAPIAATPPMVAAGIAGVFSVRAARTLLPAASAVYLANGLFGVYLHVRGTGRRPGGWSVADYNVVMGPPLMAPGLMAMVGGMGILASLLRGR
ncbi:MAG TPA: hypothetical protein VIA06_05185 [Candidatus Dormibacteraeota bacterium]|nr:hypothetical protein [Candidatus Dormibacteraeota bacterium]